MDVPVEEIKEERPTGVVQNLTFNDNSSNSQSGNYNQYHYNIYNIPDYLLENQQDYINLLKKEIEILKAENEKLRSGQ
ncbi:hypothetical protein HNP38_000528 [Chryseobacterium defluvii]|uniref:Uncharacterized protein n=1 Tax=Chryseobacterium defluvii TaxID=160396 RepID=A0A840K7S2_9FLAO|nr:hypothetical protein [Chryseobacterium defluvii]MBB4805256.1 hypothetical protein [Chryseobacterium defluvii]